MPPSSLRQILGAPPSTASPTDSVLVIIDAQNEYAKGQLAVKDVDESRAAIKGLLEKYRDAKGKVVHVQHQVPEGAPIFTPGTELFDEFEELTPKDGEARIVKHHPGAFSETNLKEVLEEFGLNKLVVTGYMAHVCVSTTVRQADERGYEVLIAADAVGDRDIPDIDAGDLKRVALAELNDTFGTVVQSSDIK